MKLITLEDCEKIDREIECWERANEFDLLDEDPEYHQWLTKMWEMHGREFF